MDNHGPKKCHGWFVFYKNQLLLYKNKQGISEIPVTNYPPVDPEKAMIHTIGTYQGITYQAYAISQPIIENEACAMVELRASYLLLPPDIHRLAGKAFQLLYWDDNSRYCPSCGTATHQNSPISKQCPECHKEIYPTISTAILVLVQKQEKILLVHAHNFSGNFYSLIAGFLEPGESLEACVRREVLEETGLRIKNITYFGNQPWPYPSGLMVGFIAEYESGEITLQTEELRDGKFYDADNLPELPGKLSLARKMIDWWILSRKSSGS